MPKLYLIDGYGFVFRAFHSMPPLSRPDGTPIGAVYGFSNMLMKFLMNHEADMIAVALDSGQKTFRHDIYPEYKSNRPVPPEELVVQFPIIREVVEAFNVQVLEKSGYEADDLIATYTKLAVENGVDVKIISSDKDLMQLVDEKVSMYDAMKDKAISFKEVEEKFGVKPSQVLDVLSLIGDSSDHVPGVKGIGQKGAAELINEFCSLDGIYNNLDKIPQARRKQLLVDGKENAYLSRKLIALDSNTPHTLTLDDLKVRQLDNEKLANFMAVQGFKSLLNRVSNSTPNIHEEISFKQIKKLEDLQALNEKIHKAGYLSLYYAEESMFLSFGENHFEIKLTKEEKQESLFDVESNSMTITNILAELKQVLEMISVRKISHDIKKLIKKAKEVSVETVGIDDIGVMSYAIDTGKHKYDFRSLIDTYLSANYAQDSNTLYLVYKKLYKLLLERGHVTLYETVDRKLISVLADMEFKGVRIDKSKLAELTREFSAKVTELETKIYNLAGEKFNIGSPKQLGEILFVKLGIQGGKKSKTGSYSTGIEILEKLAEAGHEIATLIIEWRQFSKLINTYTVALQECINPKTGRVHTTFKMTDTSTGRLSSTDPNLQNIPIRSEEGHKIRAAFSASEGNVLISADYSQIELRLLAEIANIQTMKDAFKNGLDIHAITAGQMFSVPVDQVDSNLRRKAKTINFGIIYGISAFGLASRLGIAREAARLYIESYFKQYPGIKEYMDKTIHFARANGFIETLFGRKCYINGINDKNFALRGLAERAAINAPLQGTASDIIKKAMVNMPASIRKYMVLQIHDELLFEVPQSLADKFTTEIKTVMEGAMKISVPLEVEVKTGHNWFESH